MVGRVDDGARAGGEPGVLPDRAQAVLLGSFHGNTSSPQASALLNQQAVLKEQLAQMQVSGATDTGEVVLVTPAQAPVAPSSPRPVQDGLLGLAAGLALGLGAAFLRDSLDDRLSSKEAAEHAGGAPVLAMTPVVTSWRRQQPLVVTVAEPTSPAAESYRSLRTSLQFARQERQLRALVLTSPGRRGRQDLDPGADHAAHRAPERPGAEHPMTGKVAIITGGSKGIGAGLVAGYRGRGWAVVASALMIKPSPDPDLLTVEGDITKPVTQAASRWPRAAAAGCWSR